MNNSFEIITSLEYRLKAVTAEVMAFKSGQKYIKMENEFRKTLRHLEQTIKKIEEELADARAETVNVRNQWFEVFEDVHKESSRKLQFSKHLNKLMEKVSMYLYVPQRMARFYTLDVKRKGTKV